MLLFPIYFSPYCVSVMLVPVTVAFGSQAADYQQAHRETPVEIGIPGRAWTGNSRFTLGAAEGVNFGDFPTTSMEELSAFAADLLSRVTSG